LIKRHSPYCKNDLILILEVMIVSGFGFSKETMMIYDELKNVFPKVTLARAKKCRTIQYGIAEPCLAVNGKVKVYQFRELKSVPPIPLAVVI